MAYNKVVYGGNTLIDLTDLDVTAGDVVSGVTFIMADGTKAVGNITIPTNISDLNDDVGLVIARGDVPNNTNLDSVTTRGVYWLNGDYSYTNAPTTYGFLEVLNHDASSDSGIIAQRIVRDSREWTRRRTLSNTWTSWNLTNTYGFISEEVVLADNITISASTYGNGNLSVAKSGYTPIGVVGFHLQNASTGGSNNTTCAEHSCYLSGSTCYWIVRNTSTSATAKIKVTATILYAIA